MGSGSNVGNVLATLDSSFVPLLVLVLFLLFISSLSLVEIDSTSPELPSSLLAILAIFVLDFGSRCADTRMADRLGRMRLGENLDSTLLFFVLNLDLGEFGGLLLEFAFAFAFAFTFVDADADIGSDWLRNMADFGTGDFDADIDVLRGGMATLVGAKPNKSEFAATTSFSFIPIPSAISATSALSLALITSISALMSIFISSLKSMSISASSSSSSTLLFALSMFL